LGFALNANARTCDRRNHDTKKPECIKEWTYWPILDIRKKIDGLYPFVPVWFVYPHVQQQYSSLKLPQGLPSSAATCAGLDIGPVYFKGLKPDQPCVHESMHTWISRQLKRYQIRQYDNNSNDEIHGQMQLPPGVIKDLLDFGK
jgi:hypothetical protein